MELWRIILQGYAPVFPDNLTRREEVDCQFNANALHIIQQAMSPKEMAHIRTCKSAKDAWKKLTDLFTGNESI